MHSIADFCVFHANFDSHCFIGNDLFIAGGGERALFEARACGAQVEIADDNSKLQVSVASSALIPSIFSQPIFLESLDGADSRS